MDHGHDEAVVDGHRQADIDVRVLRDRAVSP